jgi:hypothetical protein
VDRVEKTNILEHVLKMQYKVPQYIEVEDKLFGPFTLKQFSYLMGGFGLTIILWRTFADSSWLLFILAPVIAFTLALTFLKPNGKPFIYTLQNFIFWLIRPRKLFWKKPDSRQSRENVNLAKDTRKREEAKKLDFVPKLYTASQIENLAKKLNKR